MLISFSFIIASLTGFFTTQTDIIVKNCQESGYEYVILDKKHTYPDNDFTLKEFEEFEQNSKINECIENSSGLTIENVKLDYTYIRAIA